MSPKQSIWGMFEFACVLKILAFLLSPLTFAFVQIQGRLPLQGWCCAHTFIGLRSGTAPVPLTCLLTYHYQQKLSKHLFDFVLDVLACQLMLVGLQDRLFQEIWGFAHAGQHVRLRWYAMSIMLFFSAMHSHNCVLKTDVFSLQLLSYVQFYVAKEYHNKY